MLKWGAVTFSSAEVAWRLGQQNCSAEARSGIAAAVLLVQACSASSRSSSTVPSLLAEELSSGTGAVARQAVRQI